MAQLKDTLITGGLRVTDTTITNVLQATAIKALTSSNDSTYSLGTAGQVLVTDGTSKVYWSTLGTAAAATITDRSTATIISSNGTTLLTEKAIYYGLPQINHAHNYTSDTDIYAPTSGGSNNTEALVGAGPQAAPQWKNISPSITIGTDTSTSAPTIQISVLGQNATAQSIPIASTSAYGVTKLVDANNINSTASDLAATPSFVRSYLADGLAANDAMVFKGTLGSTNGSVSALPADGYSAGWTYRVADAGTYAEEYCEVGDLIIAIKDYIAPGASTDWAKIEHNIDGAVYRGNANSLVTNKIVYATGASQIATATNLSYTVTNNIAELAIGQNQANSSQGAITLYGTGIAATQIMSTLTGSTNRIMYLPNYSGNGYLTHTADTNAVGSSTLPVYVAANGRITAINKKIDLGSSVGDIISTGSNDYGFTAAFTHTYNSTSKPWVANYIDIENNPTETWTKQIDLIAAGTSGRIGLYNRHKKIANDSNIRWILYVDTNEDENVYIPDWKSIGSSTKPIYFDSSGRPNAVNCTLGANVPTAISVSDQDQNTKFLRSDGTWAKPSYTANTDTATAADNIFDGSNSGTQITYAPYTSQQNKLSFDISDTNPTLTDRLNLNGYLYATKLYSGGAEVLTTNTVQKYHTSGSWLGLVYTATSVGGADPLTFTIPTGASATTVAVGNHTHTTSLTDGAGNNAATLAYGSTYTLTTGGTSVVFTMPTSDNSDTLVNQTAVTNNANYYLLATTNTDTTNTITADAVFVNGVTVNPSTKTITASIYQFNDSELNNKAKIQYNTTTNAIDFVFLS